MPRLSDAHRGRTCANCKHGDWPDNGGIVYCLKAHENVMLQRACDDWEPEEADHARD
jgi:hypothetical protein